MICINRSWLAMIGMTDEDLKRLRNEPDGNGLATSDLWSFGGGGNGGRDTQVLQSEPEPRTLILVAMADRYGVGARYASVTQLCVADDRGSRPTAEESRWILAALGASTHPMAGAIAGVVERAVASRDA